MTLSCHVSRSSTGEHVGVELLSFAFDIAETFSAPLFASAKPVDSGEELPFQLFMSPSGSDNNDGLSRENALLTLSGVQQKLIEYKPVLDQDVEVRIEFVDNTTFIGQSSGIAHLY